MTEETKYRCGRCGAWGYRFGYCDACLAVTWAKRDMVELLAIYTELRSDCIALERLIDESDSLIDEDLQRLDKAVTVMKVGYKMAKKVLRARGIEGCLKPADEPELVMPNAAINRPPSGGPS